MIPGADDPTRATPRRSISLHPSITKHPCNSPPLVPRLEHGTCTPPQRAHKYLHAMERARRGILMDENDAPCPPSPTSKPSRHVPSSPMKPLGSYRRPTTDKSRERSPAVGLQHVRRESGGRKRAVYCDVVLGRGFDPSAGESTVGACGAIKGADGMDPAVLDVLGTSLAPTTSGHQTRPHMSSTPSKAPNVDQAKVRSTLVELYMTEDSYCRKITSLQRVRPPVRLIPRHDH